MLFPKKVKHRKWHHHAGAVRAATTRMHKVSYGGWGLKAVTHGWVSSRQIESARKVISRSLKKGGKMWVRIFPDKPITVKGSEVPMGSGKGAVDHYVANIRPGMVLFELDGVEDAAARHALVSAGYKLSVRSKAVKREDT
ncbi:50S ribosomal protein L16 [Candidatus Uhrbacteria bacterium RIFCSPHIGHO2_12_FULL_54_23]|uniref:50S ribosomal protein L16 n=3 Tax=Candidatus Uhriibacteriota TaxID=1752732 RepID=A0A1F7UI54_9BACT|nr:MAG: 50S ribosomal protein L16 [Candidatus Uhrbacteria bacterium RIFCSPHIGHO2_12_FULL_54_23]OGL83629.1 MAG: 50S ribosomal protein L16 [Candidatus Uhrbacteria bacterium RIFCSPLOWO2_01_FULL_55_36]OGL90000.1 MAG: 50S ribosomal protein L16 [Candidatus Uhrbacteria bacterium RIFCSPLOWO2_02_FULL_54_37]